MRFFYLLLCFLSPILLQGQSLLDTKIRLEAKDISIEDALLQLSEKANCGIYFNSNYFKDTQRISLQQKEQSLQKILKICLKNSGYTYKVEGNNIRLFALPPPTYTISGFVEDSLSGERLVAATVFDKISGKGTTTNDYGFYSLSIPKGNASLNFSYLGFQSQDYQLSIRKNFQLTVGLNSAITLGEIIVTDAMMMTATNTSASANVAPSYQSAQFQTIPTFGGEMDIIKYFQTLPGVQSGSDGFGGMQVRGGEGNQNLVLLDGVPVYNPSHSLGLFSIFNSPTIKSATLHKGSFPARFSGRLSSVLDVRTREGSTKEFHGGLNMSLLSTSLFIEGPIKKDKTGFLVSLRRTHIDPLVNSIFKSENAPDEESRSGYYFYDMNIKLHHQFSDKDRVYFSFYNGRDDITDDRTFELDSFSDCDTCDNLIREESNYFNYNWGNSILSLRWNHIWNPKLFSNTTLTYSKFGFQGIFGSEDRIEFNDSNVEEFEEVYAITYFSFASVIQDAGLKIDFDYLPSTNHHFKLGAGLLVRNFAPSVVSDQFEIEEVFDFDDDNNINRAGYLNPTFTASELNLYGEDEWKISDKLKANIGIHATTFVTSDKIYPSLQPRLAVQYQLNSSAHLTASINHMQQFLHVLQSSSTGIPNDLWVPSTKLVRPQSAWQADFGLHWQLPKNFQWTIEGYYKKMDHLITYQEETDFLLEEAEEISFDWENQIATGKGWAYGLETALTRRTGKTTGWLNYHLAWSDRQFDGINQNLKFPFRFNQRHQVKIGCSHQFTKVFNLSTAWQFGSGQWISWQPNTTEMPDDFSYLPTSIDPNMPINNYRLANFHRLDLNANFSWKKKRGTHQLSIGLYNVYSRENNVLPYASGNDLSLTELGLGTTLPSFRYGYEF